MMYDGGMYWHHKGLHLEAELIEEVLNAPEDEKVIARVREKVNATMKEYPLFAY